MFFDDAVYIDDVERLSKLEIEKPGSVKSKSKDCPFDSNISIKDLSVKARGPKEDQIFALDIQMIKNIRRGNTLIEIKGPSGAITDRYIGRKGLPKFFDIKIESSDP